MKHCSAKILSLILSFALLMCCTSVAFAASTELPSISGSGTVENPYQINTREQIEYLRVYSDKNFILTANISFSQVPGEGFTPIDNFTGTLNGNGYAFIYLNIKDTASMEYTGFFRTLGKGSKVYNLHLRYCDASGDKNVGMLAGILAGSIDQIYVEGGCGVTSTGYTYAVGGLCAVAEETASITNVILQSGVRVAGDVVGGLAGISKSAKYNNVFFLGQSSAIQGPYSVNGALFGKQVVTDSYTPAQNVYWNTNNTGAWSNMNEAAGIVEKADGSAFTGTEGLVGVVPPSASTVVFVGSPAKLIMETIPAGVPIDGTWKNPSANIALTSDGVVTGTLAGKAYGDFVMPFFGSTNAVFSFEITVK